MRYCLARYEDDQEGKAYRIYIADAMRILTENTSRYSGGRYIQKRYSDIIAPQKVETRTGDEIKAHMKDVLGRLAVSE